MDRVVPRLVSLSILLLVGFTLSCGGGMTDPPRMLTAISVTPTVAQAPNGQTQVQFVATGTFTEPPTTVTPLAVSWNFANTPLTACSANNCAQITSQGVAMCGSGHHFQFSTHDPACLLKHRETLDDQADNYQANYTNR